MHTPTARISISSRRDERQARTPPSEVRSPHARRTLWLAGVALTAAAASAAAALTELEVWFLRGFWALPLMGG